MEFLGENGLSQVLESIKTKMQVDHESLGFKTKTVASVVELEALTTSEGGMDGNTLYFVGDAAPYQLFVWNGTAYIGIGDGAGTVDSELGFDTVNLILSNAGFPIVQKES